MSLRLIEPGAVIERIYYAVPTDYTIGTEFSTFLDAVDAALTKRDETEAAVASYYPIGWPEAADIAQRAAHVKAVVDLRWVIRQSGGSTDVVIERTNVAHLSHEHCAKMREIQG